MIVHFFRFGGMYGGFEGGHPASGLREVVTVEEMQSMDEAWDDWLALDNPYAVGDCKTMRAGGGKYLNFIKIVLHRI